jgi:hypothetical protein
VCCVAGVALARVDRLECIDLWQKRIVTPALTTENQFPEKRDSPRFVSGAAATPPRRNPRSNRSFDVSWDWIVRGRTSEFAAALTTERVRSALTGSGANFLPTLREAWMPVRREAMAAVEACMMEALMVDIKKLVR